MIGLDKNTRLKTILFLINFNFQYDKFIQSLLLFLITQLFKYYYCYYIFFYDYFVVFSACSTMHILTWARIQVYITYKWFFEQIKIYITLSQYINYLLIQQTTFLRKTANNRDYSSILEKIKTNIYYYPHFKLKFILLNAQSLRYEEYNISIMMCNTIGYCTYPINFFVLNN